MRPITLSNFSTSKKVTASAIFLALMAVSGTVNRLSHSASLTSVSVTSDNVRPSFRGALTSGNTAGTTLVTINDTQNAYPSTSSAQLVEGDSVRIGEAGSLGSYTVESTPADDQFTISTALASGDADDGDDVVASQSAELTVRFTTVSAVNNGKFRILVPALDSDTASADGIPDGGYFDYGSSAPTVTCPSNITNYTFGAASAAASSVTIDGTDYHSFVCPYTGTGSVSTAFDGTTNDAITIDSLINPAPKDDHTVGTADRHTVLVQHLDSSDNVVDSTSVSVGVIEAVKVTAEVAPLITFRIIGVNSGTSACGANTSVTTTPALVPFGELLLDSFRTAAQFLTVSTNAAGGYAVTAVANDQLGRNGDTCTGDPTSDTDCIPDSRGDDATMSHTAADDWSSTSTKGFGYSLDDVNTSGTTPAFEYSDTAGNCAGGGDCFKHFADAEDNNQAPQTIFSDTAPADNHNLYVCYKAIVGVTQAVGNYENYVTYTATATF